MLRHMQASQERFNIKWKKYFYTPIEKIKKLVKKSWTKTFSNFFPKFVNSFPKKLGNM
jgi:hypothetical protein